MNYKCYTYGNMCIFCKYLQLQLLFLRGDLFVNGATNIFTALEQYMISLFWLYPVYLFCAVCYVVLHFPLSCMPWLPITATTLPMNRLCRLVIAFVFCPVLQTKWDIQEHPALHECGLHCTLYPWMLAQVGCIWSQGKELIQSVYYTSSFSVRSHVVYALV